MPDNARRQTDKLLAEMERHIADIYRRADAELNAKAGAYFEQFYRLDEQKRQLVEAGKMTEEEYKKWRMDKLMTGKHWSEMKTQAAQELLRANETAMAYINDQLPRVYSINYNGVAGELGKSVSGYSFELVDENTVKNLATSDKTLLPYRYVDGQKDVRWNTQKVNAEVLQGILQGESIDKIASRLEKVGMKAEGSAIRNARTTVTSAENKGRMDMLHDAADKGVICHKVWSAIHDGRTRDHHADLDGDEKEIDEPFENTIQLSKTKSIEDTIMYPGDPDADPANIYNCRCSLKYKVISIQGKKV